MLRRVTSSVPYYDSTNYKYISPSISVTQYSRRYTYYVNVYRYGRFTWESLVLGQKRYANKFKFNQKYRDAGYDIDGSIININGNTEIAFDRNTYGFYIKVK